MTDMDTPFYRFNPLSSSPAVPDVDGFNGDTVWFMHINKTAGSAVKEWFKVNGYGLLGPQGVHEITGDVEFESPIRRFYFTIVRNPYDRVASHFFMWRDNHQYFRPEVTLDKYVKALHERHIHPGRARLHARWGRVEGRFGDPRKDAPILALVCDNDKTIRMVKAQLRLLGPCSDWLQTPKVQDNFAIFKCEELDKLEDFFTKRLPFTIPLEDIRVELTETKCLASYRHLYSKESIEFIQELYAEDFRNLRYDR